MDATDLETGAVALLSDAVARLRGLTCGSVVAGPNTGYALLLGLGARTPRREPLSAPHLSETARNFDFATSLYIATPWRLRASDRVLATFSDEDIIGGVRRLESLVVEDAQLLLPCLDLRFGFGSLTLDVFCEAVVPEHENYHIELEGVSYAACGAGVVKVERSSRRALH